MPEQEFKCPESGCGLTVVYSGRDVIPGLALRRNDLPATAERRTVYLTCHNHHTRAYEVVMKGDADE
ncbi:hypothetical protein OM076_13685 [Solirubrobacter ginsenosidimutans]|uniref:Uncharacterized protein n=1 Tax=Solirubrobacter ginsenosidimutans TaxID=490573 RepID=A0A9X3S0H9_9ACTN|nr:hypothetical protein [Solirubrobacter ginsenosidimutans]MDA0161324.1 hypothetical protein [Solirubrobacter ginsenosidimutans]